MHCHAPLIEDLGIIIRLQGKAAAKERRTEEDIAQSSGVATKFEWLILIQLHQFSYYLTLYLVAVEVKKKKKKPVLTVYFLKWANAGRCWAADQHLLRSYKRFECNRDLKLGEVRCLEYRRSFTTRRENFTSSSRSRRQFLTQHPPHGLVVASP